MNRYVLVCKYCDWRRTITALTSHWANQEKCQRCNSKDTYVKDVKRSKIDTYVGCPPFPSDLFDVSTPSDWDNGDYPVKRR